MLFVLCVMLSRLFIAALWSPEERADLLALVCDVYCDFVSSPFGILGQVLYLIVSITDLRCLSFMVTNNGILKNRLYLQNQSYLSCF